MKKTKIAIVFGGQSNEHEVSLQSAQSIISAIDTSKFDLLLIGIDKSGKWRLYEQNNYLLNPTDPKLIRLNNSDTEIYLASNDGRATINDIKNNRSLDEIDVVFPVLHGSLGEDGTIQGLFKLLNVAFVGAGVLGSAIGMDKDVTKRLLRDAGIPIARFFALTPQNKDSIGFNEIVAVLGLPLFIKPANAGSSVGVHKVGGEKEYTAAINDAFKYDKKILVEEFITGREVECAVLGNDEPVASVLGEITPHKEFYSYEAKYIDAQGATLSIPAKIEDKVSDELRKTATKAFKVLCCEGLARVDFFLKPDSSFVLNEINTMPGFTKISMYPKLWEASGLAYKELITRLIELALERHKQQKEYF